MRPPLRLLHRLRPLSLAPLCLLLAAPGAAARPLQGSLPVPTTLNDFHQPGSQPQTLNVPLDVAQSCSSCHGFYDPDQEPYRRWNHSLMAQATRDPVFHACLAIAEQDAAFVGDLCLRCHTTNGWMAGRSEPTDGSGLDPQHDFEGVTCHFCHRLVDPVYDPGSSPPADQGILQQLAATGELPPADPHSGQWVLDPDDNRRGPFDLGPNFFYHYWFESPFHREAALCGTCHDVSNPAYTRQADGTYALNQLDTPHPTQEKRDEFPVERTYSEWTRSDFARMEIEMGGRFGGNKTAVATCQDCHMPDTTGYGCQPGLTNELRDDLPLHDFNGGNTWVLKAVRSLYPDSVTDLDPVLTDASIQRAVEMLQNAADLHAFVRNGELVVRVVNQSGHKLPTGYPEGRRMWLNLRFYDRDDALIAERGHYDPNTADLTTTDTTVFETKLGLDQAVANLTGLPPGESFHFALNNVVLKDNRVPPRGFTNSGFETVQAAPVDATYDEQQYWSDSTFAVPAGAVRVEVALYYQTTSKEYITFLRDENNTNSAGQVAYAQWDLHGKSAPVQMAATSFALASSPCPDPIPYGLPTETTVGTYPRVSWQGTPSLATNDFELRLEDSVPFSLGALYWSAAPDTAVFSPGWGTWYLERPLFRLTTFSTDAQGSSAWIPVPVYPTMIGTERYYQFLVRDPLARGRANLSPALHVDFCE